MDILERATEIRDEMIAVARRLSSRDCGAMEGEMREAQIAYIATLLRDDPAFDRTS